MFDGHWLPVVMLPHNDGLQVSTWDIPAHDHTKLVQLVDLIGKSLGFQAVTFARHHRLFFSSTQCGAMAMAFLHHTLLNVMLPTPAEEVNYIHERFRNTFFQAVSDAQLAFRPWIWGSGDDDDAPDPSARRSQDVQRQFC